MASPNVDITLEPSESGSFVVQPLAPISTSSDPQALLTLRINLVNHEATAIHLSSVRLVFTGPPTVSDVVIAADVTMNPGASAEWHFATAKTTSFFRFRFRAR